MKNSNSILIGILGAAAAGVVIGMVLAPKKGEKLRKDIRSSAGDFTNQLGDLLSKGKDKYNELRSMLTDEVKELKREARDLAVQAGNGYKEFSVKSEEFQNDKKVKS